MKKRILLCMISLVAAVGCGKKAETPEETPVLTEEAGASDAEGDQVQTEDAPSGEDGQEPGLSNETFPRDLTAQELQDFTIWINQGDDGANYGFLLSEYERPQDVDLDQVFYTGAGLDVEPLSEQEREAFLQKTGTGEISGDTTRLTTAQIQEYLLRRTGVSYEEMTHPLSWIYLEEYDIYVSDHGDTNYMNFTCVSGRQTGDGTWELDCVPGNGDEDPSWYGSPCRLTLKGQKGDYQFVSNLFVDDLAYSMDIWRIEEQCFDTELEGWGKVTFSSYAPDQSIFDTGDAVFCLEQDGERVYRFPEVMADNRRPMQRFVQVRAVSFPDYDEDGNKDVIIINEYRPLPESTDQDPVTEVRLYRNRPDRKEFTLDADWMDVLNASRWNHDIQEVMDHMGDAGQKVLLDYLTDSQEI